MSKQRPTTLERLAKLEAQNTGFATRLEKIENNTDFLVAEHNKQKGMARIVLIGWTGLVAIAAGFIGRFFTS